MRHDQTNNTYLLVSISKPLYCITCILLNQFDVHWQIATGTLCKAVETGKQIMDRQIMKHT